MSGGSGKTPTAPDESTTLDPASTRKSGTELPAAPGPALVVIWSGPDPSRLGEVLLVPQRPAIFGRGAGSVEDGERVLLVRQRPGVTLPAPALENPWLSRKQLSLAPAGDGVRVENLGRTPLLVDGEETAGATVRPGQVVELKNQLVLLCTLRPLTLPAAPSFPASRLPAFGGPGPGELVGESPVAWELRERIAFLAARSGHVLVLGESGTGKELVARALHELSPRAGKPLVSRSAATLPPGLIDAELFGNARDYPNPGMPARPGLVGAADRGTLFLDEIGELPSELQTHLLRVLDRDGEYQRLGESEVRRSELRLVAATNRPASALKHDLAARLSLRVTVPGLHERAEDVPLVARHLLLRAAASDPGIASRFFERAGEGAGEPRLSPKLVSALVRHRYELHVRELEALLWRSLASSKGELLELTDEVRDELDTEAPPEVPAGRPEPTAEELEALLAKHGGVQDRVWRELGLKNRFALRRLLQKHGVKPRT